MNCVLCVGTPPTFVKVDGVWGSVGYVWQHLDRDQGDTPELCSNMHTGPSVSDSGQRPKNTNSTECSTSEGTDLQVATT
jgi:hypothetical protein